MKEETDYFIERKDHELRKLTEAAERKIPFAQSIVDQYDRETEGGKFPEITLALVEEITLNSKKLDQLAMDVLPEVEVSGVKLKKQYLDVEPVSFKATKQAIQNLRDCYKQIGGSAPMQECFTLSADHEVDISEEWLTQLEERHTVKAETPVEKHLYDAIQQIQTIVEDTRQKTGLRFDIQDLVYPGKPFEFRPMKDVFKRLMRDTGFLGRNAPTELLK